MSGPCYPGYHILLLFPQSCRLFPHKDLSHSSHCHMHETAKTYLEEDIHLELYAKGKFITFLYNKTFLHLTFFETNIFRFMVTLNWVKLQAKNDEGLKITNVLIASQKRIKKYSMFYGNIAVQKIRYCALSSPILSFILKN